MTDVKQIKSDWTKINTTKYVNKDYNFTVFHKLFVLIFFIYFHSIGIFFVFVVPSRYNNGMSFNFI